MATSRRKEREKEQRRNTIIDAAEKLFFSKGYDNVTMGNIAKECELAKGTLYLYYKNKESLYAAVAIRGCKILNEMFKKRVPKKKTGLEKILETGFVYMDLYKKYPDYYNLMRYSDTIKPEMIDEAIAAELKRMADDGMGIMYDSIRSGIADGSIMEDVNPLMTAMFLIRSTESVIDISETDKKSLETMGVSHDDLIRYSLEMMRRAIEKRPCDKDRRQ
ncbi:TetR/AcrR family transcriptional regulator [Methanooceanicella nereidis]|nr:TetR/AcrR family transcriptional regulator [Methanocella sp. CWC-04]